MGRSALGGRLKQGFVGPPRTIGAFFSARKPTNGPEVGVVMMLPCKGRVGESAHETQRSKRGLAMLIAVGSHQIQKAKPPDARF